MNHSISRQALLASFQQLKGQFDDSLQSARQREQQFELLRRQFLDNVDAVLKQARKRVPKTSPIHAQVVGFIETMRDTQVEWDAKVSGRDKGVEFRARYEDSLLVFVNGKVKSGKSSLGNYMAWGDTDPTPEHKRDVPSDLVPSYFSAERAEVRGGDVDREAELKREFRVGATEATSSIQGFSLPGLTWVDSPGMHSLNQENEALARSYVEHADLILYTMKSDAPGRASDMKEVHSLIGNGKEILLLLTGSDDIETDVDDNGELVHKVVMKDRPRRMAQCDYVRKALEEACGPEAVAAVNIVSISARHAQLHADDPNEFADSGMGELCAILDRIACEDAVRIKRQTPVSNLLTFVRACHAGLARYDAQLLELRTKLDEMRERSGKQLNVIVHQAHAELQVFIDARFEQLEAQRAQGGLDAQLGALQQALNAQFRDIAHKHLASMFESIMDGFASAIEQSYVSSGMVDLPDFAVEKATEKIPRIQSGTRTRNGLLGSLLGGGIGFLVGGPAGAALGASIGGGLGGATGDSASTRYDEIELTVGDNLQQIRLAALRSGQQLLDQQIRTSAAALWNALGKEVDELGRALSGELHRFEAGLRQLEKVIEKELAS